MNSPSLRARRELYNCTDAGNAQRLARLLESRGPDAGMVYARHLVARLPSIVRAEAQQARAAAADIDPRTKELERAYCRLVQQAATLDGWAAQCAFDSTQDDALLCLERKMREGVPA